LRWTKVLSLDKTEVAPKGYKVLSIEGAALRFGLDGVELFISSEKERPYPEPVTDFRKPGTGIWTIERLAAPSLQALRTAKPETSCFKLQSGNPADKGSLAGRRPGWNTVPVLLPPLLQLVIKRYRLCHADTGWQAAGIPLSTAGPGGRPGT
jgi:hypothetical protein